MQKVHEPAVTPIALVAHSVQGSVVEIDHWWRFTASSHGWRSR
jgi:hypothetical protein